MPVELIIVIVLSLLLLLAMALALAAGVDTLNRISGWIFAPAGLIGLVFYSWAYVGASPSISSMIYAILRGVYATCAMFLGRQDFSSVFADPCSPVSQNVLLMALFWLAHLGALFVTASTILSTLGKKLLQILRIRLRSLHSEIVYLIYGLNKESVILGQDLAKRKDALVVFVDSKLSPMLLEQVIASGAAAQQAPYLLADKINEKPLKTMGIKRGFRAKSLRVFLLNRLENVNINLAHELMCYFAREGISTDQVHMDLRCNQDLDYRQLEQFGSQGGNRYDISVFSDAELSARLLVHESAPYQVMAFDEHGVATHDFHALVLGFGAVGQHVLRQLVMNGQFQGSTFRADVVDRNAGEKTGSFVRRYTGMMQAYDIQFHEIDVRAKEFYDLLDLIVPTLRYIVICMNRDEMNYALTADLERYFSRLDEANRPIILVSVCNRRYVATMKKNIRIFDRLRQVYNSRIFLQEMRDSMAKAVNLSYQEKALDIFDAKKAWANADYFSRESSRASADFVPAMVKIAGFTQEGAAEEARFEKRVSHGSALMESLSITEHLRWNAFHYAMGFTPMSLMEMEERAVRGIEPVRKDTGCLRHACLVPWDMLDEVGKAEARLTNKPDQNYKDMDRKNIRKIPRTLAFGQELDTHLKKSE